MDLSLFFFSADGSTASDQKYRLVLDCARFGDERGFTAVWTPERHFQDFGGLYPDPSVLGAALAAVTKRIRIRAGSVVLPLHHPVRIAEEWSVVDNLSGGRVGVSCATGWHPADFLLADGLHDSRRQDMYRAIRLVRRLWANEVVTFADREGRDVEVRLRPPPIQAELPIWLTTATNIETWRSAGEIRANVLTTLGNQSMEDLRTKVSAYRTARERAGHRPGGVVTVMLHTFVTREDEAATRSKVLDPMLGYLSTHLSQRDSYVQLDRITEDDRREMLQMAFDHYFDHASLLGSPDKCSALIDRLADVGVNEVACLLDFGLDRASVLAGLEVLDELRIRHAPEDVG